MKKNYLGNNKCRKRKGKRRKMWKRTKVRELLLANIKEKTKVFVYKLTNIEGIKTAGTLRTVQLKKVKESIWRCQSDYFNSFNWAEIETTKNKISKIKYILHFLNNLKTDGNSLLRRKRANGILQRIAIAVGEHSDEGVQRKRKRNTDGRSRKNNLHTIRSLICELYII